MDQELKPFYYRCFLNKLGYSRNAYISICRDSWEYTVEISDCDKKIRLHQNLNNLGNFENGLEKLKRIRAWIDGLIKNLESNKDALIHFNQEQKIIAESPPLKPIIQENIVSLAPDFTITIENVSTQSLKQNKEENNDTI